MTFWEITGWAILVGIAVWVLVIGLDTLLHNLLERRRAKQLRDLNRTADLAALGADAVRRQAEKIGEVNAALRAVREDEERGA